MRAPQRGHPRPPAGAPAAASASCPGSCRPPPPRSGRARRRAPRPSPRAAPRPPRRRGPSPSGTATAARSTGARPPTSVRCRRSSAGRAAAGGGGGAGRAARQLVDRRGRVGVGAQRRHRLVLCHRVGGQQLRPRALLRAELAQPQLPAVLEPHQDPRGAVAQRRSAVEELEPAGRHQVDEQRQVAGLDGEHLADAAHAVQLTAGERLERRVERLQGDEPRRERRLHARARDAGRQAACGDLDLGQLGHASRLGWSRCESRWRQTSAPAWRTPWCASSGAAATSPSCTAP